LFLTEGKNLLRIWNDTNLKIWNKSQLKKQIVKQGKMFSAAKCEQVIDQNGE